MLSHFLKPFKKFRKSYIPGIITGSADNDPASISTYSVAGAIAGFSQLWLLIISTPLLIATHLMTVHIGDITKKGLLSLIKEKFGRRLGFLCLFAFLTGNILTLIADIVGMAAGFQLLVGASYIYFIIPLIIFIWYIIVFDTYAKIIQYFSWFSMILVSYVIAGILAKPDWLLVLKSIIFPRIQFNILYCMGSLALLGAFFSPYTFFWQTNEEVEERNNHLYISKANKSVMLGFIYNSFLAFFIIIASATAISKGSINALSLQNIAFALKSLAGNWAPRIFGLGIVGSGLLAVPILVISSAYAVAEFYDWPEGLCKKPARAKGFYSAISFGFFICLLTLFFKANPIKILFYSQVAVGIITPLLLYFILRIYKIVKIKEHCYSWFLIPAAWISILLLAIGDLLLFCFWI